MTEKSKTKVLVFGGNGFMGGETVVELLAMNTFDITVVNRGHWDDFDAKIRIKPFVKTITIDRYESNKKNISNENSLENLQMHKENFVHRLVTNILMQ